MEKTKQATKELSVVLEETIEMYKLFLQDNTEIAAKALAIDKIMEVYDKGKVNFNGESKSKSNKLSLKECIDIIKVSFKTEKSIEAAIMWIDYKYRDKKDRYTLKGFEMFCDEFRNMDSDVLMNSVKSCISKNYKGLFEVKVKAEPVKTVYEFDKEIKL